MIRVALCVIFWALCLNVSQISTDETTSSQKTTTDSSDAPTSHADESKQGVTVTTAESYTEIAVTKIEDQDQTETSTMSINSNEADMSIRDSKAPIPPKQSIEQKQDVDDNKESLLTKPEWTFRDDRIKNISNTSTQGEENAPKEGQKRQDPGYIGKLTGGLVLPALKAKDRFSKVWNLATQGTKDVGGGVFEAATGAFNFLESAASAVFLSG